MEQIKQNGHPLSVFMAKYGLYNKDIAAYFDKTPQTIYKWLKGIGSPNMGDLASLSEKFGLIETSNLARDWIEYIRNNGK